MSNTREIQALVKDAERQGWVVVTTKGNHLKWLSPLGGIVYSSSTPSDHRALANLRRDLRVYGLIEVTKKKRRNR
jgi:predicted RNA binding protein YcfA (HicA-like mRNA interferase family)